MAKNTTTAAEPGQSNAGSRGQTPPEVKIWIGALDAASAILKLVSMGTTGHGSFRADTEHWSSGVLDGSSFAAGLRIVSEPFGSAEDETSLATFVTGTTRMIDFPRAGAVWNRGLRVTPSGRDAYCFSTANPDGGSDLAILFEVERGALRAVVLVKQGSQSGAAWMNRTFSQSLTPATLSASNDDWYYTLMESPAVPSPASAA